MSFIVSRRNFLELKDVIIFENQRPLRESLVDDIVKKQKDHYKVYGVYEFPGALIVAHYNKKYYLIDGQHRYAAMKKLKADDIYVSIEERKCKSLAHINHLYVMINNINSHNNMITDGVVDQNALQLKVLSTKMQEKYPAIWTHNKSAFPYINISTFEKEIKIYNLLEIKTVDEIYDMILKKNKLYGKTIKDLNPEAYLKAKDMGGFYLHYKNPKSTWVSSIVQALQ